MYNTLFTYRLLGYLSSAKQPLDGANYSLENCTAPENQSVYDYIFMSGTEPPPGFNGTMEDCRNTLGCGYCYNITAKLIKAVSPGKSKKDLRRFDPIFFTFSESSNYGRENWLGV